LSSCLKGEIASAMKVEQARAPSTRRGRLRDILGPKNFFLEMQYQGIEEQKIVNEGCFRSRAISTCRSSAQTMSTTSGRRIISRTTSCSASARQDRERCAADALPRGSVLLENRRANGGGVP
jgi:DNA polymerase III alpha subunit